MNKVLNSKTIHILTFNLLLLILYVIFYGRFGDINVDSFREFYIPSQMLEGQILYKNIFCIYTPLAYIINAFLIFVFGANLNTLYTAGLIASGGILTLVYKISCKFLPPLYGLGIVLFMISVGVLGTSVFNFIFPYSYGMLYGLLFILGSVYFVLRKNLFWAYLLYSLAVCAKYEFILFLPILVWYGRKTDFWKNILGFILPFILTAGILIIQGVEVDNIIASVLWVYKMTSAKTLNWFYGSSGIKFSIYLIPLYLLNFLKIIIPFGFLYYFRNIFVLIAVFVYFYLFANPAIFICIFPVILILSIIRFREINKKQLFLIFASLLVSVKVFFGFLMQSYGIFFIPFALIPIFILLSKKQKKSFLIILFTLALVFGVKNSLELINRNTKISSGIGIFYADKYNAEPLNELAEYIKQHSDKTDTVIVYPEGLSVNVLTERKSDNKFYSLIPLYVETFGEEIVKSRLDVIKPKYIIISNYDTSNYYYRYFGEDYASEINKYINEKYNLQTTIGNDFKYKVYKSK